MLRGGIIAVVSAALATALLVVVLRLEPGDRAGAVQAPVTGYSGSIRPSGLFAPRFVLRDERGRRVDSSDLRGRVTVVMFVYSTCRDTCPLTAQQVRGALDQVRDPAVRALAVSVAPEADTPRNVHHFLVAQHIAGRIPYLVGSRAALRRVWHGFGVAPQTPRSEHAVSVVVVDRAGRQRVGFGPTTLTVDALAHDLRLVAAS